MLSSLCHFLPFSLFPLSSFSDICFFFSLHEDVASWLAGVMSECPGVRPAWPFILHAPRGAWVFRLLKKTALVEASCETEIALSDLTNWVGPPLAGVTSVLVCSRVIRGQARFQKCFRRGLISLRAPCSSPNPSHEAEGPYQVLIKFPHTRIIIDCSEVFCKRPSGLQARKQLFLNYKHHTTVEFLVGISPSGVMSYVSDMWGGRASDKNAP